MNPFKYIFFFVITTSFSQAKVETTFISKTKIQADIIAGLDNFGNLVYTHNNAVSKDGKNDIASYANIQLGNIATANAFNPLKINVFYKDFNTAVILDNRLNEIYKIDFNKLQPYKNVTYISTGHDNTLWLLNQDTQQLEVYDYKQNIIRVVTLPIKSEVLDLKSNYNNSWVLTENHLSSYNYFGSMIFKIDNNGYTALAETDDNIILKRENNLFYLPEGSIEAIPVILPELLIKAFFVKNETLYIYDGEFLHQYLLKTK